MPEVVVRYNPDIEPLAVILSPNIQQIVADALSCTDPGGSLTAESIDVEFRRFGSLDQTNGTDLMITVNAMHFPSRDANLKERNKQMAQRVKQVLKDAYPKWKISAQIFTSMKRGEFDKFSTK